MAIVQISKIQQRSGNIVDLPQLDEAEFGWATDVKKLYIGKSQPNENIEVLTSYSNISFSQIDGSGGNLNINSGDLAAGQLIAYNGSDWINAGGNVGGLVSLGDVSNVRINGGAVSYVLETDGTGNLSWTPKSTIIAYIKNVTQANPAVVTTVVDNFLVEGAQITITNIPGMTQLNGNTYYANVLTSNSFSLYYNSSLSNGVNSTSYTAFPYTSATATNSSTDRVTVGNSSPFTLNDPVVFIGTLDSSNSNITANTTYYVNAKPTSTTITLSETAGGPMLQLGTATLTANVYTPGGRLVSVVGASGTAVAGGSNSMIQYNQSSTLGGTADFTIDYNGSPKVLTLNGTANVSNLSATSNVAGLRLLSTATTGTAPLIVSSTTRVANLNVATSGVANTVNDAAQPNITSVGTLTSVSVSGNANIGNIGTGGLIIATGNITGGNMITAGIMSSTGNGTHGNIITGGLITATGNITGGNINTVGTISTTGNANVGNINATTATITTGNITTINSGLLQNGNSNVTIASSGNVTINAVGGQRLLVTSTGANITGTLSVSGNANIGNLGTTGVFAITLSATGNSNVGNIGTSGVYATSLSATGNANVGNVGTTGVFATTMSATGNATVLGIKTDNYYYANGAVISFAGAYSNSNVAAYLPTYTGNLAGGNLNLSNNAILTVGANTNVGTITGNWTLSAGSRLQATYADLAEYYEADNPYKPGTVLEFGGDKEVTLASDGSTRVAGVVSSDPAYVMNAQCPGHAVAIALQGRVPVKVRGTIKKGDMLVSAGDGFARPSLNPIIGSVIGKSLANFDGIEGVVEIAVGRL